jgi:hypothetical protein
MANQEYSRNTQSWIGYPLSRLIEKWGPPGETDKSDNERRAYVWVADASPPWTGSNSSKPHTRYHDQTGGLQKFDTYNMDHERSSQTSSVTCRTRVITDAHDQIIEVAPENFLGVNHCRFISPPPARGSF